MNFDQKREIILKLKEFREKHEISHERAVNMVIDAGESASVSTAKKIFAPNSEDYADTFRMDTLKAYERAFFGAEAQPENSETTQEVKDYFRGENEYLKGRMVTMQEVLEREIARQEHTIKVLRTALVVVSVSLAIVLALVIAILIYDLLNRDVGWFRDIVARAAETVAYMKL